MIGCRSSSAVSTSCGRVQSIDVLLIFDGCTDILYETDGNETRISAASIPKYPSLCENLNDSVVRSIDLSRRYCESRSHRTENLSAKISALP